MSNECQIGICTLSYFRVNPHLELVLFLILIVVFIFHIFKVYKVKHIINSANLQKKYGTYKF